MRNYKFSNVFKKTFFFSFFFSSWEAYKTTSAARTFQMQASPGAENIWLSSAAEGVRNTHSSLV